MTRPNSERSYLNFPVLAISNTCNFQYLQFPLLANSITCKIQYLQIPLLANSITCKFHYLQFPPHHLYSYFPLLAISTLRPLLPFSITCNFHYLQIQRPRKIKGHTDATDYRTATETTELKFGVRTGVYNVPRSSSST